jgi:hypothetical protein
MDNNNKLNNKAIKKNRGGFRVPENYLDIFDSYMLKKIEEDLIPEKTVGFSLKKTLWALIPLAAILVLGYFIFVNTTHQNENNSSSSELSWDEHAGFEETWIINELADLEQESDTLSDLNVQIDYLIDEGVTSNEIWEVYEEML